MSERGERGAFLEDGLRAFLEEGMVERVFDWPGVLRLWAQRIEADVSLAELLPGLFVGLVTREWFPLARPEAARVEAVALRDADGVEAMRLMVAELPLCPHRGGVLRGPLEWPAAEPRAGAGVH